MKGVDAGRRLFSCRLNIAAEFKRSDGKCVRSRCVSPDEVPFSRFLKSGGRSLLEEREAPVLRGCDEEERQDRGGVPEMAPPGLRRVEDGPLRRRGGPAAGVRRLAAVEGIPARHAGSGTRVPEEDGLLLVDLADARGR